MFLVESELNSKYDAIVIGGGLTGCVVARRLAEELGYRVLILEKRNHIGGNLYDYFDDNGILIQKYGPHIFHTNSDEIFHFVSKYCDWKDYNLRCMVHMCGKNTPSPFNFKTIDDFYTEKESTIIKNEIEKEFEHRDCATIIEMLSSKNPIIKKYADFLFEHDYSLYTAKQWGVLPSEIDISVLNRVPIRFSYEDGYFSDKYQILPIGGFSFFIGRLIDHEKIDVVLSSDFTDKLIVDSLNNKVIYDNETILIPVIYTGELDRLLNYRFGCLPYRSLHFENITLEVDTYQPAPVVAYPEDERVTRIVEYK
jgi:UDP-galactopyranose mutase